jgi:hypothetical protein
MNKIMDRERYENEKILLWLDDYRDPFDPIKQYMQKWAPEYLEVKNSVVWVKNHREFIEWITKNGLPDKIAFDHDLANEHYAPQDVYAAEKYDEWEKSQNFRYGTGMDAAKWLVEYCMDNEVDLPMWVIQSANPNGARNIASYLVSYMKHAESNPSNDTQDAIDGTN